MPGHDFAGRVESVGDGVDEAWWAPRWRSSRRCRAATAPECAAGKPSDCKKKKLIGLWSDGCLTEKVAVPLVNLVPRPDGVEAWQASLLEPLAVGLNTVDRLQIMLGETVLVLGQGPIGLALTRLCALSGAGRLIVTDARDAPFAVSRAYGATDCINVAETDVKQAVADLTERGAGADIVIETSGFPASSAIVLDVVRKEGKVAHIGWANDLPPLPGHPDHGQDADRVRGGRQRRPGPVRAQPGAGALGPDRPATRWSPTGSPSTTSPRRSRRRRPRRGARSRSSSRREPRS